MKLLGIICIVFLGGCSLMGECEWTECAKKLDVCRKGLSILEGRVLECQTKDGLQETPFVPVLQTPLES